MRAQHAVRTRRKHLQQRRVRCNEQLNYCAEIKTLMSQLETESAGAIDDHTVREVQRNLDGLVISEIDKARGELCIM